ncbi:MAG: Transcriptional regulator, HxlR family [Frankiales bacterium]|nr:Transcriptional regulator, HxlR family [Frankiales bacterium]
MTDPLAAALALVGDRWTFLVVRELGLGEDRFEGLLSRTGAPRAVLTGRLRELQEHGLVQTHDYREPRSRTRQRYVLTDAGRALKPVLAALSAWGEDHAAPTAHPYSERHRGCGGRVTLRLACECGQLPDVPDVLTQIATTA